MGIEPIQMAKTKALPPASRFNWSQIGINCTEQTGRESYSLPLKRAAKTRGLRRPWRIANMTRGFSSGA